MYYGVHYMCALGDILQYWVWCEGVWLHCFHCTFQVGEVFVNLSIDDVQERQEQTRTDINQEIEDLKRKAT